MTDFNTDYNNTELLDQELSFDELQEVNGGCGLSAMGPYMIPTIIAIGIYEEALDLGDKVSRSLSRIDPFLK